MHTVLQILAFGIGSSSSRWCLGVVGVLICMHSSTDSDIRPPQANFISQAHITSQAYTRARLARPRFLCFSMTSQADLISQANITSRAYTRARLHSVGGRSMDMWCPYGIGRESWVWDMPDVLAWLKSSHGLGEGSSAWCVNAAGVYSGRPSHESESCCCCCCCCC